MTKKLPKHLRSVAPVVLARMTTGFARFRYGFADPGERIADMVFIGNFARRKDAEAAALSYGSAHINSYLFGALLRGWTVWRKVDL